MTDNPIYEELIKPDAAEQKRIDEVNALRVKADTPEDTYDGHHGTDRSADSLAYAIENSPGVAEKIKARIAAFEGGN